MNIAFVTDREHDDLTPDDRLLVNWFAKQGHRVIAAVWDDPDIKWDPFDAIVIRSVWDYFKRIHEFDRWLEKMETVKKPIFNPLSVVRWNKNKTYLGWFKGKGILIPEGIIRPQGHSADLKGWLEQLGFEKAVIKPTISGGAYKTWVTTPDLANRHQTAFDALLNEQDVILQRFSEEIVSHGELSLIYFNRKFSHAICKKAKPGDFRVQTQYGGQYHPYFPEYELFLQVEKILELIPETLLYARIDGYLDACNRFVLMELELIEPALFLDSHPDACRNFYEAFTAMLI